MIEKSKLTLERRADLTYLPLDPRELLTQSSKLNISSVSPLALHILDRFCFALRLIQAPNKRAGYQLVASKTIHRTMTAQYKKIDR